MWVTPPNSCCASLYPGSVLIQPIKCYYMCGHGKSAISSGNDRTTTSKPLHDVLIQRQKMALLFSLPLPFVTTNHVGTHR